MAELNLMEDELRVYARAAAREIAASLEDQILAAIALLQENRQRKVRVAMAATFGIDDESGMIRPEYTVKRSQAEEARKLPGVPLGPQVAFPELISSGLRLEEDEAAHILRREG